MGGVEISLTVGLELSASRIAIQVNDFPYGWCIIEIIFLHLFINLFNKYVLRLSTGRFYFVQV